MLGRLVFQTTPLEWMCFVSQPYFFLSIFKNMSVEEFPCKAQSGTWSVLLYPKTSSSILATLTRQFSSSLYFTLNLMPSFMPVSASLSICLFTSRSTSTYWLTSVHARRWLRALSKAWSPQQTAASQRIQPTPDDAATTWGKYMLQHAWCRARLISSPAGQCFTNVELLESLNQGFTNGSRGGEAGYVPLLWWGFDLCNWRNFPQNMKQRSCAKLYILI